MNYAFKLKPIKYILLKKYKKSYILIYIAANSIILLFFILFIYGSYLRTPKNQLNNIKSYISDSITRGDYNETIRNLDQLESEGFDNVWLSNIDGSQVSGFIGKYKYISYNFIYNNTFINIDLAKKKINILKYYPLV